MSTFHFHSNFFSFKFSRNWGRWKTLSFTYLQRIVTRLKSGEFGGHSAFPLEERRRPGNIFLSILSKFLLCPLVHPLVKTSHVLYPYRLILVTKRSAIFHFQVGGYSYCYTSFKKVRANHANVRTCAPNSYARRLLI